MNVSNKRLPFPTQFKYELKTADAKLIVNGLKKMPTKIAVIDDAGYIQTNSFMAVLNTALLSFPCAIRSAVSLAIEEGIPVAETVNKRQYMGYMS